MVRPGEAVPVQVLPVVVVTPVMVPEKSPAALAPPLLLMTVLMTIKRAALSSLVTVQVLVSPSAMAPLQPEYETS